MTAKGGANPYRKGAAFENRTARWLRELGCLVVRVAASKGDPETTPFDLVSILDGKTTLVECKLGGWLAPEPRKKLVEVARRYGVQAVLAKPSKTHKGEIVFQALTPPVWSE